MKGGVFLHEREVFFYMKGRCFSTCKGGVFLHNKEVYFYMIIGCIPSAAIVSAFLNILNKLKYIK